MSANKKKSAKQMDTVSAAGSISLCMILKDEAENLPACLDSVWDSVDEIVIVDTGSSDATCEIALRYGARLFHMDWPGDFSLARNYSLSQARMGWVFVLDADETIAKPDGLKLRELTKYDGADAFNFTTRNYTDDFTIYGWVPSGGSATDAQGYGGWVESKKIRLFRNNVGITFAGAIHETVEKSILGRALKVADAAIPIHHYGKTKGAVRNKAKSKFYSAIAENHKRRASLSEKGLYELAVEQKEATNYRDACATLRRLIKLNPREANYHLLLACSLEAMDKFNEAALSYEAALSIGGEIPQAHNNLGLIYHKLGHKKDAIAHLNKALDSFYNSEHVGPDDPRVKAVMRNIALVMSDAALQNTALPCVSLAGSGVQGDQDWGNGGANVLAATPGVGSGLAKSTKQKISLCMIVKNEESNLPACLESARALVDEIVIVDTGSKDGTLAVAKSFGAKIVQERWRGDFSHARNVSLASSEGDWALVLDADERLEPQEHEALRSAVNSGSWDGISFRIVNYGQGSNLIGVHFAVRAFKKTGEAKFRGKAHEEVVFCGRELLSSFTIHHHGYGISADALERKLLRDLALIKEELKESPDDLPKIYYSARTLFTLGRYGEAADEASHALDVLMGAGDKSSLRLLLAELLAASLLKLGEIDEAERVCEEALSICPYSVDLLFTHASIMVEKNDLGRAKRGYERYLNALAFIRRSPSAGYDFKLISTFGFESRARSELGRICSEMGLLEQSVGHLQKAASLDPSCGAHWLNLAAGYERLGDKARAQASYRKACSCGVEPGNVDRAFARLKEKPLMTCQSNDSDRTRLTSDPKFDFQLANSLRGV